MEKCHTLQTGCRFRPNFKITFNFTSTKGKRQGKIVSRLVLSAISSYNEGKAVNDI